MSKKLIFLFFVFITASTHAEKIPLSTRYPKPWRENFNLEITRSLSNKNIRGCGQYKFRESSKDKGEYLVYCSRDGRNWLAYIVWPNINNVMGPYPTDSSLD